MQVIRAGCLLSSLPSDIVSNVTGIDFTCDLNDNIAAPWTRTLGTDASVYSVCGQRKFPSFLGIFDVRLSNTCIHIFVYKELCTVSAGMPMDPIEYL